MTFQRSSGNATHQSQSVTRMKRQSTEYTRAYDKQQAKRSSVSRDSSSSAVLHADSSEFGGRLALDGAFQITSRIIHWPVNLTATQTTTIANSHECRNGTSSSFSKPKRLMS